MDNDDIHSIHIHKVDQLWTAIIHLKDGQKFKLENPALSALCAELATALQM